MTCKPNKPFPTQAGFFFSSTVSYHSNRKKTRTDRMCLAVRFLRAEVWGVTPEETDRWMVGWAGSRTRLGPIHGRNKGPALICSQLIYKWGLHLHLEGVPRTGRYSEIRGVLSFLTKCPCNYSLHRPQSQETLPASWVP